MPNDSLAARRAASPSGRNAGPSKNGLEWTVFALSLAVVALVVGALVQGRGVADAGPPRLRTTLGVAERTADGIVRVPVALAHDGGQTVAHVAVEVTDGATATTLDFGYAARGTTLDGAALFDTLAGPLSAHIVGYTLP